MTHQCWMLLFIGMLGVFAVVYRPAGAERSAASTTGASASAPARARVSPDTPASKEMLLHADDIEDVDVPDHLQGFKTLVGDPRRGNRILTERLSCLGCHSIVPGEDSFAPNLSDVGRRLSTKRIVTSILEPSREIAGSRSVTVATTEGRVIRGVEGDSNDRFVVLITNQGEERLHREQIEAMTQAESDMPSGQADDLSPQEFVDLIAALKDLGKN